MELGKFSYVILDDSQQSIADTQAVLAHFGALQFAGAATNYDEGLDLILALNPSFVFLEISPENSDSKLSLGIINELYRYLEDVPKFIITTNSTEYSLSAMKFGAFDYHVKPLKISEMRKTILRCKDLRGTGMNAQYVISEGSEVPNEVITNTILEQADLNQTNPAVKEKSLTICVKSYGDYRFICADDICYLQADNNSTDIHLNNGEMITAFKTLKHFENVLHAPFVRIHNSYIVNIDYVSRIHTGNAVCYIKNTAIKLPFSKSYKENVDSILNSIIQGNYLEI